MLMIEFRKIVINNRKEQLVAFWITQQMMNRKKFSET